MCRSALEYPPNGKRCEKHGSPAEQKARRDARNARRREQYRLSKEGIRTELTSCVTGRTHNPQDCHITYMKGGVEHTFQAYNETAVTGKINPQALTSDSYKELGFNPDAERWKDAQYEDVYNAAHATSLSELKELNAAERVALSTFTTNSYEELNRYLYNSPRASNIPAGTEEDMWLAIPHDPDSTLEDFNTSFTAEGNEEQKNENVRQYATSLFLGAEEGLTAQKLTDYVNTVDEAFSKADGRQRIVYRGEKFFEDEGRFKDYEDLKDYTDKNYITGSQVTFKGMQSTSVDPTTAQEYADDGDGGIIYEISTPSGIGVTSVSAYAGESEILLPRNTTYRVVGKTHLTRNSADYTVIQLIEVDENDNIRHAGNLRKKDEFGEFDASRFVDKSE